MEPDDSLPCSWEPVTSPYPDRDQLNTIVTFYFSKIHFNITPTSLCLGLPSDLFPFGFPIKTVYAILQCVLHSPPISSSFVSLL
jgi:hypothetical protein